jgi:RNA recognition motif-containing protein
VQVDFQASAFWKQANVCVFERMERLLVVVVLLMSSTLPNFSVGAFLTQPRPLSPVGLQQFQQQARSSVVITPTTTWLAAFKRTTSADKYKSSNNNNNNNKQANNKNPLVKKLSPHNDLLTRHEHRIATAGKIGTLRYADPTMIFLGNLNFTATESQLRELLDPLLATPWDIHNIQLVTDWKSGDSKGYAFVQFTQPVFATLCLQELNGKQFLGRALVVKPALAKSESPLRKLQRQEQAHQKALRRALNPPPPPPEPKQEDPQFLAYLDPDLAVGLEAVGTDVGLFDDDTNDDDYDGWEVPGSPSPKGFG